MHSTLDIRRKRVLKYQEFLNLGKFSSLAESAAENLEATAQPLCREA